MAEEERLDTENGDEGETNGESTTDGESMTDSDNRHDEVLPVGKGDCEVSKDNTDTNSVLHEQSNGDAVESSTCTASAVGTVATDTSTYTSEEHKQLVEEKDKLQQELEALRDKVMLL